MSEQQPSSIISDLLHQARKSLNEAGIETAALEARVLLCHVSQMTEAEVVAYPERTIDDASRLRFLDLVDKRTKRIPLAHLLGVREFWGLEFSVNDQTLIPRPETEFAVELAVDFARSIVQKNGNVRVLDLGTGTGCLLISILHEVENANGVGVDINPKAVELAKKNAKNLGVDARARFQCMNWGEELEETFDIIVSNPPYIQSGDLTGLMPEVSIYEPVQALDGGADGLDEYRKLIPQARELLNKHGLLILEIGKEQAGGVLGLLGQHGFQPRESNHPVKHDLAGYDRIISTVKVC